MFDEGIPVTAPPDDTGSLTFARYCYQARVAFRYVLACASAREVDAVIPEHFEDVAIHFEVGRWHLLQIKTRDLGYGPWTLTEVTANGGAFQSLLRAFRSLPDPSDAELLVAVLEGAIKHDDALAKFVGAPCDDADVADTLRQRLGLSAEEARLFIPCLRVVPEAPRTAIDAMNLRRLAACMPDRRVGEIETVYGEYLALIQLAMEAALLGADWAVQVTQQADSPIRERVEAKTIDRARLAALSRQLGANPAPLLARLISTSRSPATRLEEKLLAGGAIGEVIAAALDHRARADHWAIERRAASVWPDDEATDDLDVRLTHVAIAAVARHATDEAPANGAWGDISDRLMANPATHDPRSVYAQDPILLMGRVCGLSDDCAFEWRGTHA